ncbi:MAG: CrcB family protein [Bacteroidia bacterium]|nr:CrcB family protein [Bacteroidia bacterium]
MKLSSWSLTGAVSIGAIFGALLRFWMQRWFNSSTLTPLGTFLVNSAGAFVLGLTVGWVGQKAHTPWFYGITAGFCGSLTTFSSIVLELFEMIRLEEPFRAIVYLTLTVIVGMMSLLLGYWLGSKLF